MTAAGPAPLLTVESLRVGFATATGSRYAVDGIAFDVREGEALGVVGESGSGKTMLCRAIMRLTPPWAVVSGSVRLGDVELAHLSAGDMRSLRGTELAMVLQNPMTALNPVVRVGRQLTETLRRRDRLDRATARARAVGLLDRVGIPEPARRLRSFPHELSGGMCQLMQW